MHKNSNTVIARISEMIVDSLQSAGNEQRYPQYSSDEMDERIQFHSELANDLRRIREELENTLTGYIAK